MEHKLVLSVSSALLLSIIDQRIKQEERYIAHYTKEKQEFSESDDQKDDDFLKLSSEITVDRLKNFKKVIKSNSQETYEMNLQEFLEINPI